MTGNDIIINALWYRNYVYWYGAKGEECTYKLLNTLSALYPGIYTTTYKQKCMIDIRNGKHAIDCSGLVCRAYGISNMSTYEMPKYFAEYNGPIKNGMIVWRHEHVGLYYNGVVIEARGIDYDVTANRIYKKSDWERVYISPAINYDGGTDTHSSMADAHTPIDYLNAAKDVLLGIYGNGTMRKNLLEKRGFNYEKIQSIINISMEVTK